jgi:hypothetical protein
MCVPQNTATELQVGYLRHGKIEVIEVLAIVKRKVTRMLEGACLEEVLFVELPYHSKVIR